jgi:hypothetical protein
VVPTVYNTITAQLSWPSIYCWPYLRCCWRYSVISMCSIQQSWYQIDRTSSSLRYVKCGPGHIQWIYSSGYSGFNIKLNLPALLLEICHHLDARYAANFVSYIAHTLRFTLCELLSRTYAMKLQHGIFRIQYSTQCICAAIGDISTIQCSLYCKHGAKYSARTPVCAMWTVVPDIYNALPAPYIPTSILDRT